MVTGGSSNPQWQGSNFASKDVIYVNFNYRESIFGAPNSAELSGTSQNFNILDVEAALEWVHRNIAGKFHRSKQAPASLLIGVCRLRRRQEPHCLGRTFLRIRHGRPLPVEPPQHMACRRH